MATCFQMFSKQLAKEEVGSVAHVDYNFVVLAQRINQCKVLGVVVPVALVLEVAKRTAADDIQTKSWPHFLVVITPETFPVSSEQSKFFCVIDCATTYGIWGLPPEGHKAFQTGFGNPRPAPNPGLIVFRGGCWWKRGEFWLFRIASCGL